MKSKLIVGLSLLIFAVIVINVIAIGLLSPSKVTQQDLPPVNQSSENKSKTTSSNSITPLQNQNPSPTKVVTTTPTPAPKRTPTPVTRAS